MKETTKDILARLQEHINRDDHNADVIDGKAQIALSVTSLILSVVAAQKLQNANAFIYLCLGLAVLLYVVMFILTMRVLNPREFKFPLKADWDLLQEYDAMEEQDYVKQIMSDYVEYIAHNYEIVEAKAAMTHKIMWLLFLIVLLLVMTSIGNVVL